MYFPRKIENELKTQITKKEIVVLTGMRRTGKTTLLKRIYDEVKSQNKIFLDLENPLEQKIFDETDYNNILENLKALGADVRKKIYLFIDEIQFMPQISSVVKYLFDHYNIKFFLSGSSSFYLKNLFPQSLSGRKVVYELYPLTFSEFLIFKGKNLRTPKNFSTKAKRKNEIECEKYSKLYREYLEFGGFPQVVLEEDVKQKRAMLSDIFNSYFQIDILTLNDFKKIEAFKKLIFLLMERSGSKIDISKIASLSGVSRDTIYSYLNLLQGSYFIHFIEPFSRNRDKEVSGTKKVYLCDTGILNHLSKVSEGALFENAVFNNLRQYGKINYYQKRTGSEIDFILNEKIAFEVKITGDERDVAKMEKIAQKIKIKQSFLITKNFLNNDKAICAYQI